MTILEQNPEGQLIPQNPGTKPERTNGQFVTQTFDGSSLPIFCVSNAAIRFDASALQRTRRY